VLGLRAFETADMALKNTGYFQCSARNWGSEFAYVTGGGASMTSTENLGAEPVRVRVSSVRPSSPGVSALLDSKVMSECD